jgi:hypothetical protein
MLNPLNDLSSEELLALRTKLEAELLSAPVQTDLRKLSTDPAFKHLMNITGQLGVLSEILSFRGVIDEYGDLIEKPIP